MTFEPGHKIGPYEIIEQAGAGGMGEVFKAKDARLERTVAIKILHHRVSSNPDLKQRFDREAKAISSLSHPNICVLFDIGQHDGTDYLVMEYLEGETLTERLHKGELSNDETLAIAIQIADALDKAHKQGLVHRDLKPGNIMLTKGGAKLLDFGLAKLSVEKGVIEGVSGVTRTTPLTGAGTILGTVPYMSPEQLEGKEADARSDIFSFGSVLYEMATGKRAFEGDSQASLIGSIMKVNPEPVSKVRPMAPPMIEKVVSQCLEKNPEDRWQSAGDLKRALVWIAEGGSQIGIPTPVSRKRRLNQRVAWGLAAVMTVAAVLFSTMYFMKALEPIEIVKSEFSTAEGTELSSGAGGNISISPDGRKVVFSAQDTTGTGDKLWIRQFNSLVSIPLPGTEGAVFPFWSPDSRYIGFYAQGKLKKILATGGPTFTLTDAVGGRGGSWNKDDVIIFSPAYNEAMFRVNAVGGNATKITQLDSIKGDESHRWPFFLPDGDNFLFFKRTNNKDNDAICLGSLSKDTYNNLFAANSNPVYSDGHILYVYEGTLMARPFDAGSLELKGDPFPIAETVSYLSGWSRGIMSVSENGHLVYRTGEIGIGTSILLTDRGGNVIDTIDASGTHFTCYFSPDGKRISMDLEEQVQAQTDIWVIDIERKTRTRITFDEAGEWAPIWSPDGEYVAFRSVRSAGAGMYIKKADGTGEIKLLNLSEKSMWPSYWTRDGKGILATLLVGGTSGDECWFVPLDTTIAPYPLIQWEGDQFGPCLSPDERWLACRSDETGKGQIYVTTYPALIGKWQVSIGSGNRPIWNDDGTQIFFRNDNNEIMVANVDGSGSSFKVGKIERLFELKNPKFPGTVFDVTPDGQRFIINVTPPGIRSNKFVVVQNWAEEFKK